MLKAVGDWSISSRKVAGCASVSVALVVLWIAIYDGLDFRKARDARSSLRQDLLRREISEDDILRKEYLVPYMKAFKSGMDHFDIAEKVFKVRLNRRPASPHSYPLISGSTFSSFADVSFYYIFKRSRWKVINFTSTEQGLENGAVIFTSTVSLGMFAKEILPRLPNITFVLISCSGDLSAPGEGRAILDDSRLIRWFAQNMDEYHPKMEPIPIGFLNSWLRKEYRPESIIPFIITSPKIYTPHDKGHSKERPNLAYVNFNIAHHPATRKAALSVMSNLSGAVTVTGRISQRGYFKDIARAKFMASPRGDGIDCHRTWEAIAMGAIPIVENSTLNPLHEQGPVLIVGKWDKSVITEEFLLKHEVKVRSRLIITADYWFDKINRARESFLDK